MYVNVFICMYIDVYLGMYVCMYVYLNTVRNHMTYIQRLVDERHLPDQRQRFGVDEVFQLLRAADGL